MTQDSSSKAWESVYQDVYDAFANRTPERAPSSLPSPRETLLDEAKRIVTGERNKSYGEPEDNSRRIAELWNAFLLHRTRPPTEPLEPYEVFLMMSLMKIARLMYDPSNYDSYLDAAAYVTVAWDAYSTAKGDSSS